MDVQKLPKDKKIVLFDGVCNLCDASVQLICKHDVNDHFRFASIQSEIGQEIITYLGIDTSKTDSIILYEPGFAYYTKAEAALRIAKELNSWHSFLYGFIGLPNTIKNTVYDYIAKNRYKWYGKKDNCMIPTPEIKTKFL
ncbi:thiol-disulfide oxidoreductase DCC family protein [Flavobacterium chuncheonense]|uniref:Thiol-disulfide oxidoreductase DCC family protein n=1 Tax=Flavobacterium chuncheonense TaxID=2026653 RepID=A0ABW5YHW0_9FLAO